MFNSNEHDDGDDDEDDNDENISKEKLRQTLLIGNY